MSPAGFSAPPYAVAFQDPETGKIFDRFKPVPPCSPVGEGTIVGSPRELARGRENVVVAGVSWEKEKVFEAVGLERLRRLMVGGCVGSACERVEVRELPLLEEFVVGDDSFTRSMRCDAMSPFTQQDRIRKEKRKLVIAKCPQLARIEIGNGAFSDFSAVTMEDLPQLSRLKVGTAEKKDPFMNRSYAFFGCESFELRGICEETNP